MAEKTHKLYSIEGGGERKMGAAAYTIVLSRAIKGVKRFQTINGQVLEVPGAACLIIYDRSVLLVLDFTQELVHHYQADRTCYLRDIQLQPGGGLSLCQEGQQGKRVLTLNWQTKQGLKIGFGPVSAGCFPGV